MSDDISGTSDKHGDDDDELMLNVLSETSDKHGSERVNLYTNFFNFF